MCPIGRAIGNTEIYILDKHQNLVPVGVPGELHIGGAGLARGYWHRPDLTKEKFIPSPIPPQSPLSKGGRGDRLYKTGDLVRYKTEGKIEFLGRIDHQVKIRGFRIELGEIEVLLKQHPQVRETVVVARTDIANDSRIVAYIVIQENITPSVNKLREFLQAKLPDYMLPSAFVVLDALPLTPNGKINRRALPVPESLRPELTTTYQAPQSATEQKIAKLWQEVLHLDQVGIHDNFFDLGGHSLLLLEVNQKLNKSLPRDLSVVEMFQHPTIASLAQHLTQNSDSGAAFQAIQERVQKQIKNCQKQLLRKSRNVSR